MVYDVELIIAGSPEISQIGVEAGGGAVGA